jgi:hypothetical protein
VALRPRLSPGVPLIHVEAEYRHLTSRYNPRQEMKNNAGWQVVQRGGGDDVRRGTGSPYVDVGIRRVTVC